MVKRLIRSNMVHNSHEEEQPKKKKRLFQKRYFPQLDKISSLPDHLVDNILSQLSIKDAVRTSILSKNWRYKWTTVSSLAFDDQCFPVSNLDQAQINNKLIEVIYQVLLHHKGPPIRKFELAHPNFTGVANIDSWIVFISGFFIEELTLKFCTGEFYKLLSCLFNCQNLTRLELARCSFKPPPTFKGFKNLKILDLNKVTMDQDVFEYLICVCPLLEKLTLTDIDGLTDLNIDAPNLQYVYAWSAFHDVSFKNTFNLTSVSVGFNEKVEHIHFEPEADKNSSELLRFFANLPHIRRLEIHTNFLKYLACGNIPSSLPNKCVDLNFLYININLNDMDETEAGLSLLRSSPNLQELEIWSSAKEEPDARTYYNLWGDHGDQHLSSSLLSKLRVVNVFRVRGVRSVIDFISFMLANAPALERMTVKLASMDGSWELVKELLQFKRASLDVKIVLLDP